MDDDYGRATMKKSRAETVAFFEGQEMALKMLLKTWKEHKGMELTHDRLQSLIDTTGFVRAEAMREYDDPDPKRLAPDTCFFCAEGIPYSLAYNLNDVIDISVACIAGMFMHADLVCGLHKSLGMNTEAIERASKKLIEDYKSLIGAALNAASKVIDRMET